MAKYEEQLNIVKQALGRFDDDRKKVVLKIANILNTSSEEIFEVLLDMADDAIDQEINSKEVGENVSATELLVKNVEEMLSGMKPEEHIGTAEREAVAKYLGSQNIDDIKKILQQKQDDNKRKLNLFKKDPRLNGTELEREQVLQAISQLEKQIITSDPEKAIADLAKADASPNKELLPFLVQELIKGNISYPSDLGKITKATANFHKMSELGLLTPQQADISQYQDFNHFYEEATKHSDPTEDIGVDEIPDFGDVFDALQFIHDNFTIGKEELKELKARLGKKFNEKEFMRSQFRKSMVVFLEYLGRTGFHTRTEGEVYTGAKRQRDADKAGLGLAGSEDITGEIEFNPEVTEQLYKDIFNFLAFTPGLAGGPPKDVETAVSTPPAAGGTHLSAEATKDDIPTRKFLLSRLQAIYFDSDKSPSEKWESMRSWLTSGMGLSAFGLQTIKTGDWSTGVDKMPRKARDQFKGQSAYGKMVAGYKGHIAGKDKNSGKGKVKKGDDLTLDQLGENMSANGMKLFLTEQEAIASLMTKHPTSEQYKQIVEAHKRGVWLGFNEGYNDVPKELDPRKDYKPESGYDTLESKNEITADDIPFKESKVEMNDMMEAVASQQSPDGKGVQEKNVGDAISGTDNETAKLKDTKSKNTDGAAMDGGKECGDTSATSDAGVESPDGKGLQKKSVGKV